MNEARPQKIKVTRALLTVQILFAINYIASKMIVDLLPPLLWASLRVLISGVLLLVFALIFRKDRRPTWNRSFILPLIFLSFLAIIVGQGAFLTGLHYTTATNSAVITTLIPIFTLLFLTLFGKEPFTARRGMGFVVAMIGVLAIRKVENISFSDKTFLGDNLVLINAISYALFLVLGKKFFETYDSVWSTTCLFLVGGIGLLLVVLVDFLMGALGGTGSIAGVGASVGAGVGAGVGADLGVGLGYFALPALSPQVWGAMTFTILGSTLLAYFLNFWALGRTHSSSVALFIYLQPILTSFLAWTILHQAITTRTLVSSLLIFFGMLLASSYERNGRSGRNNKLPGAATP